MNPKILQMIARRGMGPKVPQRLPASRALRARTRTNDLGAMMQAEDHLDMLLEEAGIPMTVLDEMTGKVKRSAAAEELLQLMELLSSRNRRS